MSSRYEQAELLAALWQLGGGNDPQKDRRLPTSHGILDRALAAFHESLPEPLRSGLTFGRTNVGLRCFELPSILLAAQEAMITTEPNPTYHSAIVNLDEDASRQIALANGLTTAQAREIGRALHFKVEEFRRADTGREGDSAAA